MPKQKKGYSNLLSRLVVRALPRSETGYPSLGRLHAGGVVYRCRLGKSGVTRRKVEGDGKTPKGRFRLVAVYRRRGGTIGSSSVIPLKAIAIDDGWCDEQADPNYNRPVKLPYRNSHERLWRNDRVYDVIGVLDYNFVPRIRGHGSAIFLHLTAVAETPTEGCIAISPESMRHILPRLKRGTVVEIV